MSPTPFQRKIWYTALTSLGFVAIIGVGVLAVWLLAKGIGFLQPVLMPLAIAGILAYLLEPVVAFLSRKGVKRIWGVVLVFTVFIIAAVLMAIWTIPSVYRQGTQFINDLPTYSRNAQNLVLTTYTRTKELAESPPFSRFFGAEEDFGDMFSNYVSELIRERAAWLQEKLPDIVLSIGNFLKRSLGGVLGFAGFLLSLILVPVFLFFFLMEVPSIASSWTNYLPLRASPFKAEVVSVLEEINGYLINFFRGQLVVSMIDGALVAAGLLILGLDFALLIGLMVGILGLIPYAGVIISWIPAVLIATAQFGDWWHPALVTVIFLAVNNLDGIFIAPKIVGDSVGLHPLTVILSVLIWSSVFGVLLGALMAVPMTAMLKVLLRRYFWETRSVETGPSAAQTKPVYDETHSNSPS